MPEGPEVNINAAFLKSKFKNKNFTKIISNTKSIRELPNVSKVVDVFSKGKFIIIQTKDYYVYVHFGITGWFTQEKPKIYKYVLQFENSKIYLQDRRRFSSIKIMNEKEYLKFSNSLGVDILTDKFTLEYFSNIIKSKKKNICSLLLDQKYFAGLGNYIKNDALYLSKVSPNRKSNTLSDKEIKLIYHNIIFITFSNLVEWYKKYKLKLSKNLKILIPDKINVPYNFFVFDREYDDYGNKITFIKNLCGRRTFYVDKLQK
jgi:formamidopyrimidine-DNA glycosylase